MLVRDTEARERDRTRQDQAAYDARLQAWAATELEHAGLVGAAEDPTNTERQLGIALWPQELEGMLQTLEPGLRIERNPRNPSKGSVVIIRRTDEGTKKENLFPCEWGLMPEYSIMSKRVVEMPFLGHHAELDTPMFLEVETIGEEETRGWRSILARLVQKRILTPAQVEGTFGVSPRKAWAVLLGKRREALPF